MNFGRYETNGTPPSLSKESGLIGEREASMWIESSIDKERANGEEASTGRGQPLSGPHLYQFQTKILSWVTTHTMKIC